METNYYDALDISKDASESEIKRAYILKLRQYPNEKFPEEFKLIRKAYETLSNSKTRKEYDTMSVFGEEIKQLQNKAADALHKQDYAVAISCYKSILMIEPDLLNIRNQYALALIYNNEQDKAIKQLEKLVLQDKDNAVYMYNLGFAYDSKGNSREAISYYKKAFELDPNDANIIHALSDVYLDLKDYHNARKVINDALSISTNGGFHQFIYLFRHLQVDVFAKDSTRIGETLKRIETLLENHPEEKAYVANEFGKFAEELFNYKQFEWAFYLTVKGIELDPTHTDLLALHEETKNNKVLYGEFSILEKDDKVINPLRYSLFLYLFANEYSEEEFKTELDQMYKNVELSTIYEPEKTIASIKRLNIKYPSLYKVRKEFFNDVLKMSEGSKVRNEQFERLKHDSGVANSLKRLLALYLSEVDDEERQSYFEDIMDEMSYEQASFIKTSINRIQSTYPALYSLNPDFLNDIKKKLTESSSANKHSNHSNVSNHSSYSSNGSSTSSSCFVATAAFGSPLMAELDYLRYWRDHYLRNRKAGEWFIKIYYRIGPTLAKPVTRSIVLRKIVQKLIHTIIDYIDNKYDLVNQFHNHIKPTKKKVN